MTSFVDPAPNIPIDAIQFISLLNLSPIANILRRYYCEPYKIKHPPEAFLRLLCLQKLKRYKFLTELYRELDDQTIKLLGKISCRIDLGSNRTRFVGLLFQPS